MTDKARIKRWQAITRAHNSELNAAARDAHGGYHNGTGKYSSGYEAGCAHAHMLPRGQKASDRRIRAFGDFLIDMGESLSQRCL